MVAAERLTGRTWPYLVFGLMTIAAVLGIIFTHRRLGRCFGRRRRLRDGDDLRAVLALPPRLSAPGDVHRTAAGMFTISYTLAVIIPTLSGALWDLTGIPWMTFVPLAVCAHRADDARRRAEPLRRRLTRLALLIGIAKTYALYSRRCAAVSMRTGGE